MTPLRQRLVDDLQLRNYAPRTVSCYVTCVARFAEHFGRSPDLLGAEEIRAFQIHMLRQQMSWCRFNQYVCALKFFYRISLQRPEVVVLVPYGKRPKKLPVVLSPEEVLQLFAAAPAGHARLLLQTAYACGLRVSEVVALEVGHIDARRMVIVVHGKGNKERLVPLSARLLQELRAYWHEARPARPWLFAGTKEGRHLAVGTAQKLCHKAVGDSGLIKAASMHTLRHSYATHMLEAGVDVVTLQKILGHNHLATTAQYLHLSTQRLRDLPSLLDRLMLAPSARRAQAEGQP
jgi:integrase/recombinase XerD